MVFKNTLFNMKYIDSFLNTITMYRLTLYFLISLIFWAFLLSLLGLLHVNPLDIGIDTGIAILTCLGTNYIIAKLFGAVTNVESTYITALILVLIIPLKFPLNATFFIGASMLAIGSKYFVTVDKRHIFNPAAAGILAISLLSPEHSATWWIGTPLMLPAVFIGGVLLMRKIQREAMVLSFCITYVLLVTLAAIIHAGGVQTILNTWNKGIFNSAFFFFAFVMLTEPFTSPPTKILQKYYAALVAFFYLTPQVRAISLVFTPEMALILGNIFSFIVSPKYRLALPLVWKKEIGTNTVIFGFTPQKDFSFLPGQYMEWTLPHTHVDMRGNRRYFSIASSPDEKNIMLMVKFYTPPSSYKKTLLSMNPGQEIIATHVAGDFTLPKDLSTPLVFIAGGVGIAPFRSIIQYIITNNLHVTITVIYSNRSFDEIAFADTFSQAQNFGVNTIYTLTDSSHIPQHWTGEIGYITQDMIRKHIPDFATHIFYLSGPVQMVQSYEDLLSKLGVKKRNVKKDYFPGY